MPNIEDWLDGCEFAIREAPVKDEFRTFKTGSGKDAVWIEGYRAGMEIRNKLAMSGIMTWSYRGPIDTDTYYGDDSVDPY